MASETGSAAGVEPHDAAVGAAARLFAGPGEMRALCRAQDWTATPIGAVEGWSPTLRTAVRLCLDAGFATCLYAGDDLVLVYNDGFIEALGRKHPWALGRPAREVWAEIWTQSGPDFERVRATGAAVFHHDQRFVLARGVDGAQEEAFYTFAFSPVHAEDGAIIGVLSTISETTARVRAEAALRESEQRFRLTADATPQIVWITDADGRVEFFNRQWSAYTGVAYEPTTAAEVAGRFVHPDDRAATLTAFDEARRTGGVFAVEHRIRSASGNYRWFLVRAESYRDTATGEIVRWFGASVDIHDRKLAEAERLRLLSELDAERERLRSVILHTPAPLALLEGPEQRFTLVNDAYKRVSGGGRDVTGLTPPQAFPELAGSGIYELFDQVYATGEPWDGPETLVRYDRDGTGVQDTWFNLRLEPVRDSGGRVVAILNFAVDVTEQVLARREVEHLLAVAEAARGTAERARLAAEAANRAKSEFLAVMSHELRTPLNAIGGYAELIELGIHGPVSEAQRTALARIQASQRHLLGLIAGVLDYSRVEAGAVTYRLEDVPVTEAVAEAESLVAPQLRAKGLGYAWSGAAPELRVRADREKLQQILLNLLGNAAKFTDARNGAPGRIEVACTVEEGAGGESTSGRIRLHVRDTGDGIAVDALERVFEPFVQADQRLTRPHAGVGLGLAISRDLARGMGGDLTAESEVGVGSTFTLTLPAVL